MDILGLFLVVLSVTCEIISANKVAFLPFLPLVWGLHMTNVYSGLFVDFTTFSWYPQMLPRCWVDWLSLVYRTCRTLPQRVGLIGCCICSTSPKRACSPWLWLPTLALSPMDGGPLHTYHLSLRFVPVVLAHLLFQTGSVPGWSLSSLCRFLPLSGSSYELCYHVFKKRQKTCKHHSSPVCMVKSNLFCSSLFLMFCANDSFIPLCM